jgi:hypothetical protein
MVDGGGWPRLETHDQEVPSVGANVVDLLGAELGASVEIPVNGRYDPPQDTVDVLVPRVHGVC